MFPKTLVKEKVDAKLAFHCVGLEKDKNVSFPTVEVEGTPNIPETEGKVLTSSLEPGDGPEVTVSINQRSTHRLFVPLRSSDLPKSTLD